MRDLNKVVAEIGAIRAQVAHGSQFRGYGPPTLAATGGLAVAAACVQAAWGGAAIEPAAYVAIWALAAAMAGALIGAEVVTRSRRFHSTLADDMILAAVERFAPALGAGALLAVLLLRVAPDSVWLLPGLWQILVGLGIFASVRLLPGAVAIPAAWYVGSGLATIALASGDHALSPWTMGVPFGIGQALLAAVLHLSIGGQDV